MKRIERVLTVLLGALSASVGALAAAANSTGDSVEEVVITGTNIRGAAPSGSAVLTVDRDEIENSSAVTAAAILQEMPQIMNFGITESSRSGNGGAGNITFGTSINIRGISPFGTLTLLNGHRMPPNGTTGAAPDPNVIPTIALERVEVVADGASAIYGSDAIVGVANLILRRNVEGFEGTIRYGAAESYDDRMIAGIFGHNWGTGRFTASVENGYHSALHGPDRDFFRSDLRSDGGTDNRVTQCNPGNIVISNVSYPIPASNVTAATLVPGTANRCDNIKNLDLIPEQDHLVGAFTFDQEVGERWNVFAEGYYATRQYVRVVPSPTQNLTVPSTNAFYVRPATAPAGTTETVQYSFARDYGVTNERFNSTGFARTFHVLGGVNYALPGEWQLEFSASYGLDREKNNGTTNLNATLLTAALASSNPATAFNPFGTSANSAALLDSFTDQISIAPGRSITRDMTLKADGKLFSIPGGDVGLAVGVERYYVSLLGGQITGSLSAPRLLRVFSERDINSAFAEVSIPLIGEGNAKAGADSLVLSLAGQTADYSDFGKTTHPKYGITWGITDSLSVRASYGTSYRAPGLSQLRSIAAPGIFLQNYSDPLANSGAGGVTQGAAINGGNVNLGPEKATTWSYGFDWSSQSRPGTSLSFNYFDLNYEDQVIGYLSNLAILQNPVAFGSVFIRRPTDAAGIAAFTAMMQGYINEGRNINGGTATNVLNTAVFVDGRPYNQAITQAKGIDFDLRHRIETERAGRFDLALGGTHFLDYFTAATATAPLLDQRDKINFPLALRARARLNWSKGNWSGGASVNYTNSYINDLAIPVQSVAAYTVLDLRLGYNFEDRLPWSALQGLRLGLDIANVTDAEPPFVNIAPSNNGGGGFDPNAGSPVGRLVALSISKRL